MQPVGALPRSGSAASSAALRCGVGIVRLVSVEKVISSAAARLPECVFLPTESENGAMSYRDFKRKMPAFSKSRAVLAGCGMTDCADTGNIIAELIKYGGYQLIIDADGLNSIKNRPELLKSAALPPVITPHIGEMARLTGASADAIKSDREKTAAEFSRKYNCITVLKDCKTVISSPEGKLFVCDKPNAGLAKGGAETCFPVSSRHLPLRDMTHSTRRSAALRFTALRQSRHGKN